MTFKKITACILVVALTFHIAVPQKKAHAILPLIIPVGIGLAVLGYASMVASIKTDSTANAEPISVQKYTEQKLAEIMARGRVVTSLIGLNTDLTSSVETKLSEAVSAGKMAIDLAPTVTTAITDNWSTYYNSYFGSTASVEPVQVEDPKVINPDQDQPNYRYDRVYNAYIYHYQLSSGYRYQPVSQFNYNNVAMFLIEYQGKYYNEIAKLNVHSGIEPALQDKLVLFGEGGIRAVLDSFTTAQWSPIDTHQSVFEVVEGYGAKTLLIPPGMTAAEYLNTPAIDTAVSFPESKIVVPPLTNFTVTASADGRPLSYNWETGKYYEADGVTEFVPPNADAVTWTAPTPKVGTNPTTMETTIGYTVPVSGQDVFVPVEDVHTTVNPYAGTQNPPVEAPALEDFQVHLPDVMLPTDVVYPNTLQIPITYTPSNVQLPALDFILDPPIAIVDPVTGVLTPTANGDAIVTVRARDGTIAKTQTFSVRISGVPSTIQGDWPDSLGQAVTTRFPFSLPWDVGHLFSLVNATPIRPEVNVDQSIAGLPFKFNVSFAFLDPYMPFFRAFIIIGFLIYLAYNTRRLLGGAQ